MNEQKGSQWKEPISKPSEEHGENYNNIRENTREEIIKGATQVDQLEGLKPGPETKEKIDSQPVSHVNDGDIEDGSGKES